MTAQPEGLPHHFLKPGELMVAPQPCTVTTLLGSCVAVTMFSKSSRIGAICHALLPSCRVKTTCHDCSERYRHVECAVIGMLQAFTRLGVPRNNIEGKVFGGAEMFRTADSLNTVGNQNVTMAFEILQHERIRVVTSDTGGFAGRKIMFCTGTGDVYLKRLNDISGRCSLPHKNRVVPS